MTLSIFAEALTSFQFDPTTYVRIMKLAKDLTNKHREELFTSLQNTAEQARTHALEKALQDLTRLVVETEHHLHAAEQTSRSRQEQVDQSKGLRAIESHFSDF